MSIVKAALVALFVTTATPAFADEPPSDPDKGGGCASGQTELGLGLLLALGVMRRRSLTPDGAASSTRGPGAGA